MLPILLTMKSDTPLVKRTINSDPREVFDMNSHIFNKRDESLNSTGELGELIIKKPGYFDASLKLGVEENGEFHSFELKVDDASRFCFASFFLSELRSQISELTPELVRCSSQSSAK